jgi:glyoxalase family protein
MAPSAPGTTVLSTPGLHHITALASDPQRNVGFYTGFLGLRLVKQTVNFDAPDVYHLYYGDDIGRPGTILTFFPFPDASRGKRGTGETSAVGFSVPIGSFDFWTERLSGEGMPFRGPVTRFGQEVISFDDPDGMAIELVEDAAVEKEAFWKGGPVDAPYAVRRFHGITLTHRAAAPTSAFLEEAMGFRPDGTEDGRRRFASAAGAPRGIIDIVEDRAAPAARQSAGSVHHIAWRAADDAEQLQWREKLRGAGAAPTPVMDRQYFHSIYFREPGGVLFEIATDPPGFSIDEKIDSLGSRLRLPPWLEPDRAVIERHLPPLLVPAPRAREAR